MHQGRPYGLHSVGLRLTEKDQAFIDATAKKFTNLKDVSKIDSLKLVYELPDGGSFIIQDMGGNFRVITYKPSKTEQSVSDGLATDYIPMLFSGAHVGAHITREGYGISFNISKDTRKRLLGYGENLAPSMVRLQRFAIPYSKKFQEFESELPNPDLIYTQYGQQRPTWYSGAMSEVVQIVGGYGRQRFEDLPDNEIERAQIKIPRRFDESIQAQVKGVRLPAYTGRPNEDGQYQYDYKFLKTNLVSFDSSNNPWLIQVQSSGVWAMPLPIVPATATDEFYRYMQEVGDNEVLAILNRFGAMPSGESFPDGDTAFYAWVRAGVIIKVCDTKDFYDHMPYSSAMGWSSNSDGTECVNTCFDINGITGAITAYAYKIRLALGESPNKGMVRFSDAMKLLTLPSKQKVTAYLNNIYTLIANNSPRNLAIKYKIVRTSPYELLDRASIPFNKSEIRYWDNLTMEPIAQHKGAMVMIDKGGYGGTRNIKVPEPFLKGCISLPAQQVGAPSNGMKVDTIVLAYYIGDSLKTVKMFGDDRPQTPPEIDGNFEDYMYVGKWEQRELRGGNNIQGSIYLSDIDDRRVTAPREIVTKIEGKDLGFSLPSFVFDYYFWRPGDFYRFRYYTTKTNVVDTYDGLLLTAVAMPYYSRNTILYAKRDSFGERRYSESFKLGAVGDPNTYRMWTYESTFASIGGLPVMNGTPFPVDGRPVYAEILNYNPHPSNAWADEGPWLPALPADITNLMYRYESVIWAKEGRRPAPRIKGYSNKRVESNGGDDTLHCQVYDKMELIHKNRHSDFYHTYSPDSSQNTFYRDVCKVVFGSKRYANISESSGNGNRKQWGESALVDNKSAHHFIGVINE